jgi:hypothetical protein
MEAEEPSNLTPVVIEAVQALAAAGEGDVAARLMEEYRKICDAFRWHAELISSYHKIGAEEGARKAYIAFQKRLEVPKAGSLAEAIWKLLRENRGIKNSELCRRLERSEPEIDIKESHAKELPKGKTPTFNNLIKYSHNFQQALSKERKRYDQHVAALYFRCDYFPEPVRQPPLPPRKRITFSDDDDDDGAI